MSEDVTRLDYREIAYRYNLGSLKHGGDLQLTATGDIKTTCDGDLQLGDDTHNALHRLVVRWQFNVRALKTLFDVVVQSSTNKQRYQDELNEIAPRVTSDSDALERWHKIHHELGVEEYGPEAYAGAIMVVLDALLRREWADLNKPPTWDTAGNLLSGQSFGAVVEAAANNFRHFDEWAATVDAIPQQLKSMTVLAAVLGSTLDRTGKRHPIRSNVCPEVIIALSSAKFEILMDGFFGYARALAGLT